MYGHQTFKEPNISPYAIGIDTGCVYGDKLTAIAFSDFNSQEYSIYSTPSNDIDRYSPIY